MENPDEKTSQDIIDKLKKEKKIAIEKTLNSDERTREAINILRFGGHKLCDWQEEYLGSAVVHFYRPVNKLDDLVIKTQTPIGTVNEVQAYLGLTELKRKMMAAFGRKTEW